MAHKGMRAEIFTVDAHRNVRIKPLRAPRLVRRNDPVVKVTLETGAEIVCTPDHRFMLRDGTYREAQQLKPKDQLMPFSRSAIPERLHRTGAFPIPASLTQKVSKVEPAGRADVYDLTVDVTQNFALAAGVFAHNSIDDDPPAHMRYTEARLAAIANEMLADIEKETTDWVPNYDNRHQQPTVLPARFPNLIVNGSAGIAVGMATNIPPHNLREIVAATKRLIDDPELTTDDLCETVVGPDFPGGGVIYRFDEQRNVETGAAERVDAIRRAYAQGRGRIIARAKAHNEQLRGSRDAIIVTELPYAVNKASLIDEIIKLIRAHKGQEVLLVGKMREGFGLTEAQAKAILEMQLRRLSGLERQKLDDDYRETIKLISELESILASPRRILALIKQDLDEIATKYGDDRRTEIVDDTPRQLSQEELVADEGVVITVSTRNYVKRMPLSTYRAQHRGGRGVIGMATRDEDDVDHLVVARSHDRLYVFTDRGRVFALKGFELPDASRTAKGTPIQNILEAMQSGERVSALVALRDGTTAEHLVMATRKGFVKKTPLSEYANVRRAGLIAIALRKSDQLAWVAPCGKQDRILLATRKGKAITFKATDARPMGRQTQGVTGIRLQKGDEVVGMGIARPRTQALSVTENGFGKRTAVAEFPTQGRGGQGVILASLSPKTGNVAAIQMVDEGTQEILLITSNGVVIRTPLEQVRALGRATMGVKVMAVGETKIASIATFTPMRPAQTQLDLPR